jgi:hypothetical protein
VSWIVFGEGKSKRGANQTPKGGSRGVVMSTEESKRLIRRFYTEVVAGGDYSNLDGFVATDYVDRNAPEGGRGPEVVRAHLEAIRTTLPDFTMRIEDVLAEGDQPDGSEAAVPGSWHFERSKNPARGHV